MAGRLLRIDIDISDTIAEFSLEQSQTDQIVDTVAKALTMEIHRNWVEAAKRSLHSTRNNYIRGLIVSSNGVGDNSITLVGQLNNMIENGCSAFDMKEGFKNSAKAKQGKNGNWYITIPFRFATPGAIGESEVFAGVMPEAIYKIIKAKKPQISDSSSGKIQSGEGLKKGDIPAEFAIPKTRESVINQAIGKTFDAYVNKSSMYEGMIKNQKTYEGATQSSYNTFRRVSLNSNPLSWIHSGIKQYNLADEAMRNTDVDLVVDNAVDGMLSEFGID